MDALLGWFSQLQLDKVWLLLVTVASSLLCITFHETCHGLAAYALGDPTAKRMGRLTLNPLKHIDFVGLVMMAAAGFGWAKPVPVDMRRFRDPKTGMALTALAGPVGNLFLTWIAMLLHYGVIFYYYMTGSQVLYYLSLFFLYTATLSAGLAVFNLFPIPPLDGSKVLFSVIPNTWYAKLMVYERYGMILVALLIFSGVLDAPLSMAQQGVLNLLNPAADWVYELLYQIYF